MVPEVFGIEHVLYMIISTVVSVIGFILIKKYAKTEKAQNVIIKITAGLLFISILANRLSQVFRYGQVRWYCIIPDSYCGMSSLVLALAVLLGKKDNAFLHFVWLLGLFGGIATVIYPTFVSQDASFFYLPTISGLLHHSFSAITAVMVLLFKQINITYKKWHYVLLGLTCYITVGAFLMAVFNVSDAYHIVEPLLPNTPLTAWVMAPMYAVGHGLVFLGVELGKKLSKKQLKGE